MVLGLQACCLLMLSPASTPGPSAQGCHQRSLRPLTLVKNPSTQELWGKYILFICVHFLGFRYKHRTFGAFTMCILWGSVWIKDSGKRTGNKPRDVPKNATFRTSPLLLPPGLRCQAATGRAAAAASHLPRARQSPGGPWGPRRPPHPPHHRLHPPHPPHPHLPPPSPPAAPSLPAGSRAVTSRGGPAGHGRHFERPGPSPPLPSPPGLPRRPLGAPAPSRSRPAPPPAAPPAPPHRHRAPWQVGDEAPSRPASPGAAAAAAGRAGPREPGRGRGREAALRGAGG